VLNFRDQNLFEDEGKFTENRTDDKCLQKTRSKNLQDPVRKINVDGIPLNVLQELVVTNTADPLLYIAHIKLNKKQLDKLSVLLEKVVQLFYDFSKIYEASLLFCC